jgi:hypothetical protein
MEYNHLREMNHALAAQGNRFRGAAARYAGWQAAAPASASG